MPSFGRLDWTPGARVPGLSMEGILDRGPMKRGATGVGLLPVRCTARAALRSMLAMLAMALGACVSTGEAARSTAEAVLECTRAKLRLQALGELIVDPQERIRVRVYRAEGCGAEAQVLCRDGDAACCSTSSVGLLGPRYARPLERALYLRRTLSRARCAPETLRLIQESESLWRYEACDGRVLYHCRARGCEAIFRQR